MIFVGGVYGTRKLDIRVYIPSYRFGLMNGDYYLLRGKRGKKGCGGRGGRGGVWLGDGWFLEPLSLEGE